MDSFRRLDQLINRGVAVTVPVSDDGFCGHECLQPDCQKYFGIVLGTGLEGDDLPCHCSYCGHADEQSSFHTKDQLKYFSSVVQQRLSDAIFGDFQEMSAQINSRQDRSGRVSTKTTRSRRPKIQSYDEKKTGNRTRLCFMYPPLHGLRGICILPRLRRTQLVPDSHEEHGGR